MFGKRFFCVLLAIILISNLVLTSSPEKSTANQKSAAKLLVDKPQKKISPPPQLHPLRSNDVWTSMNTVFTKGAGNNLPQNIISKPQQSYIPHTPITINSDADFSSANGVTRGSGTQNDPYIIENWDIDGQRGGRVIYIGNTTASFVVRNCYLHNGSPQSPPYLSGAGIHLHNVQNGMLENNTCSNNDDGILLYKSSDSTLTNNTCRSNNDYGIVLVYSSNNTLTNNNCLNNAEGICLYPSSNNTLANNTCSSNTYYGIFQRYSSGNVLAYNRMVENGLVISGDSLNDYIHTIDTTNTVNGKPIYYYKHQTGITVPSDAGEVILINCTNFVVESLVLNKCSVGVELAYSSYISIRNNFCSNNVFGIYLYSSSSNTLTNNNCNSNYYYDVWLDYSSGNTLANNTCSNTDDGIYLHYSSDNILTNNNCNSNNYRGIFLDSSSDNTLTNNNCSNNGCGIYLDSSAGNTLANNNCKSNYYGIWLYSSSGNTVTNNNCSSNEDGIWLWSSSANTLTNNNCNSNNNSGIYLRRSSPVSLTYNNITDNIRYGVFIENSYSNLIHHNNFINNNVGGVQAYADTGGNFWNDTTGEGNYWSDYTARYPHARQVGNVWDTPYEVDGIGRDNYPLVKPVPNAGSRVLELQSLLLPTIVFVILFLVIGRFAKRKR